jgi:hypothetical protein
MKISARQWGGKENESSAHPVTHRLDIGRRKQWKYSLPRAAVRVTASILENAESNCGDVRMYSLINWQHRHSTYNVTCTRVRVTTVAVQNGCVNYCTKYLHSYLVIPYSNRIFSIAYRACPPLQYFPALFHKRHDFRELLDLKMCVLISSTTFVSKYLIYKEKLMRYYHKYVLVFM